MNLVSQNFIICMIITTLYYYSSPKKLKAYTLLAISIIVLSCLGLENIAYILFSTILTYFAGLWLDKSKHRKAILISSITVNAVLLIVMKVLPYVSTFFSLEPFSLLVPLGISYYTFQVISYLMDVYRNKYEAEKNFFHFALYVLYFPYLFVGPINRFDEVKTSLLQEEKKLNKTILYQGIARIAYGFFKKLVIAARIELIVSTITANPTMYSGGYAFLAMLLYSIEIYADFSGAIDVVLGFSHILQIHLAENFNLPYLATSVDNFWRRWHISLSSWFKDYLYIPLGGNRKGTLRTYFNLLIVFIVSGIWHGANYLLWGFFHGIFVIFDKVFHKVNRPKVIAIPLTFVIVSILWSFFIWQDSLTSLTMIGSLFTTFNYIDVLQNITNLGVNLPNLIVLILSVVFLVVVSLHATVLKQWLEKHSFSVKLILLFLFVMLILMFGVYGIGFNVSDFIYNKF